MTMYLWKISQNVNTMYDTYDSAVVVAETEDEARKIHPGGKGSYRDTWSSMARWRHRSRWCRPEQVKVERIGIYEPLLKPEDDKVICASFNAG